MDRGRPARHRPTAGVRPFEERVPLAMEPPEQRLEVLTTPQAHPGERCTAFVNACGPQ
jgi:hypothetical protein